MRWAGQRRNVDIHVEQRSEVRSTRRGEWEALTSRMLSEHLSQACGSPISARLNVAEKGVHPGLALADIVAYLFGQHRPTSSRSRSIAHLVGRLLVDVPADQVRALTRLVAHETPDIESAALALDAPAVAREPVVALLGERLARDPEAWREWVEALTLNEPRLTPSARVKLADLLDAAGDRHARPVEHALALALVRLQVSNDLGRLDEDLVRLVEEASARLRSTAVARDIVARADATCMIAYRNAFAFAEARACLERTDVAPLSARQAAVHASSLGQLAAFEGRWAEARARFDAARRGFEEVAALQGRHEAERDLAQVACYAALVEMDDPAASSATVDAAVERACGPLTAEAVVRWAVDERDPYAHQLLVRYLCANVTRSRPLVDAYVASMARADKDLDLGDAHPAPAIRLWRAMLYRQARDRDAAAAEGEKAAQSAATWGTPLGRLVAWTALRVAGAEGAERAEAIADELPSWRARILDAERAGAPTSFVSAVAQVRGLLPFYLA